MTTTVTNSGITFNDGTTMSTSPEIRIYNSWTHTANVSTVTFNNLNNANDLVLHIDDVTLSTDAKIYIVVSTDNGATWITGTAYAFGSGNDGADEVNNPATNLYQSARNGTGATSGPYFGRVNILNLTSSIHKTIAYGTILQTGTVSASYDGFGQDRAARACNAIQIYTGAQFTSGSIKLFGR